MKLLKNGLGVLSILAFIILVTVGGCKKSSEVQAIPVGMLMDHTECKETLTGAAGAGEDFAPGPFNDCINYQYNGVDTLIMTHINAGFNCCPGDISGVVSCNGNRITITEQESTAGCHCMCLYDLDYRIVNMVPGQYTIHIVEPNIGADDQVLEVTLNLTEETSGEFCLPRRHYPWI